MVLHPMFGGTEAVQLLSLLLHQVGPRPLGPQGLPGRL